MAGWTHARRFINDTVVPQLGFGTWDLRGLQQTKTAVVAALNAGYRLIDTAQYYGNEADVGCALQEFNLPREEYFVVTKLLKTEHGYESAKQRLKESLERLRLTYVDLFLIHNPSTGKVVETWRAFEELKKEGLVRHIGVSNFNVHHLERLNAAGLEVTPSVNQIEVHPWLQQREVVDHCTARNIGIMAYSPLAKGRHFNDGACPELESLTAKHNKTKAQIFIRWSLQKGYVCIPKSSSEKRIVENSRVFDFQLSEADMETLDGLECGRRVCIDAIMSPWID